MSCKWTGCLEGTGREEEWNDKKNNNKNNNKKEIWELKLLAEIYSLLNV